MRFYTPSSHLDSIVSLLLRCLLFHLLVGPSAASPLHTSSLQTSQSFKGEFSAPPGLHKRSNCVESRQPTWECDGDVPGVDETNYWMGRWGVVGRVSSVFYTGYPMNLRRARQWASCFFPPEPRVVWQSTFGYAIWGRLVSPFYAGSQTSHIRTKKPRHLTYEDVKFYEDLFLKHIAQSLAELSIGDVYLVVGDDVTPDNRSWDTETAWGGWEFPALTRNPGVRRILRVDPDTGNQPRVIWTFGNGPQGQAPKGYRGSTQQVALVE